MREHFANLFRTASGIFGAVVSYAHDTIGSVTAQSISSHSDLANLRTEIQQWVSFLSCVGGFVIVVLSIVSFRLKIAQQKREAARQTATEES